MPHNDTATPAPASIRAAELIHGGRKDDDPDAWHAARANSIGGSEALAILALSDRVDVTARDSPWSVWARKLGLIPPVAENDYMVMGSAMEPVYARLWTRKTGIPIHTTGTWRSRAEPWRHVNPDGLTPDPALVEIKHVIGWDTEDWRDNQTPDAAFVQVQHGMDVLGLNRGWLIAGVHGRYPTGYQVEPVPWLQREIRETQRIFWHEYVLPRTAPPIDGHPATTAGLAALHRGTPEPSAKELSASAVVACAARNHWRIIRDDAERRMRAAENDLKTQLGDAHEGRINGLPLCAWRPDKNGRRRLTIY